VFSLIKVLLSGFPPVVVQPKKKMKMKNENRQKREEERNTSLLELKRLTSFSCF